MSDKNRVITNGLFRKKMAELLGEDIVNTPQFNDFQALDVSTFTREMDKLIDNPPWGEGGGGSSGAMVVNLTVGEDNIYTSDKTLKEIYDAFSAEQVVLFKFGNAGSTVQVPLMTVAKSGEDSYNAYAGLMETETESDGSVLFNTITINNYRTGANSTSWELATNSQPNGTVYYVGYSTLDGTNWNVDKVFGQIKEAYDNKRIIKARIISDGVAQIGEMTKISDSLVEFCNLNVENGYIEATKFTHNASNVVTVLNRQITT